MNSHTEELRKTTKEAFQQYGGQSIIAKELGVKRQYVWSILNGERGNDETLMKLSVFIKNRIQEQKDKEVQKKQLTSEIKAALTA